LISVYALASYFGLSYVHSDIKQVSVHPLDPFQSEDLYSEYLGRLNRFVNINALVDHDLTPTEFAQYNIEFWSFMWLLVQNHRHKKVQRLAVFEPYSVTEFEPKIMKSVKNSISFHDNVSLKEGQPYISIHYRQGVGGFAVYPGQKIARETPLAKFENVIFPILSHVEPKSFRKLVVLTDAPTEVTYFHPPVNQQHLWDGTPGYSEGVMTVQPTNFDELTEKFGIPVEVIRGGDPLEAIAVMANAEFLLMSKSSLSYLGGFLNKFGTVYYPKDFWHRPLPEWKGF
jgi:hypothetical protein